MFFEEASGHLYRMFSYKLYMLVWCMSRVKIGKTSNILANLQVREKVLYGLIVR